jgi:hypothetical protein
MDIYYRKAHNGTMKTFIPQGTKGTMKTFIPPGTNGNRQVTRPGSKHKNKPTPEGSHVYKRGYLFR